MLLHYQVLTDAIIDFNYEVNWIMRYIDNEVDYNDSV